MKDDIEQLETRHQKVADVQDRLLDGILKLLPNAALEPTSETINNLAAAWAELECGIQGSR